MDVISGKNLDWLLEVIYVLALLRVPKIPAVRTALDIIRTEQTAEGRWIMENSLNGKMWADLEEKGRPSEWLTCFALFILQHFDQERERE